MSYAVMKTSKLSLYLEMRVKAFKKKWAILTTNMV